MDGHTLFLKREVWWVGGKEWESIAINLYFPLKTASAVQLSQPLSQSSP